MTTPICFVDTETDGVHPDRKVWEVAIIRREDGEDKSTQFFVDMDLSTADPFGLKVGRFYDRHPLGRHISGSKSGITSWSNIGLALDPPPPSQYDQTSLGCVSDADAALIVARWTHGAHLIGAVPSFDAEVLARLLRDNGLTPSWHYHLIDVEAMALGYLHLLRTLNLGENGKDADLPLPWRADDLALACGIEPVSEDQRHTAMGDADFVRRWYDQITR